jgi:hypothetical protein
MRISDKTGYAKISDQAKFFNIEGKSYSLKVHSFISEIN